MISEATVDKVVKRLVSKGGEEYFFDSITSPDWIEPFRARGYFKNPPPPIIEGEWITYPAWPSLEYLVRMALLVPDLVESVLGEVVESENARVRDAFVRAALNMPTPSVSHVARKVLSWLNNYQRFISFNKLFDLAVHLVDTGDLDLGYDLASSLMTPRQSVSDFQRGVEWRFTDWEYEHGAIKFLQSVKVDHLIRALDLYSDLLQKGIDIGWGTSVSEPSDKSMLWRPAIEDHEQNQHRDKILGTLTQIVRDLALRCVDEEVMTLEQLADCMNKRPRRIFLRITFHVLRIRSDSETEVKAWLLDPDLMLDVDIHHEFWLLASKFVPSFNEQEQTEFLEALRNAACETKDDVNTAAIVEFKRLCLLNPTENGPLMSRYKELKEKLIREHGELDFKHPEFFYFMSMWPLNVSSPINEIEFSEKSDTDLVIYLLTWIPSGDWADPSASGLAQMLRLVVAKDPSRFAQFTHDMETLDATYLKAILEGWADAVKNNLEVEWTFVIEFCRHILSRCTEPLPESIIIGGRDVDWTSVKRSILTLLSNGLDTGTYEIPADLAAKVWAILFVLIADSDPTPEAEMKFGGTNMDPPTLALNTTRGIAMHGVIRYALWRYRSNNDHGLVPEVRQILEQRLDPILEPSLAIRSIYGWWMPWLTLMDDAWVKVNLDRIFLTQPPEGVLGWIAWETYLRFRQPYTNTFQVLRPLYTLATSATKLESDAEESYPNESAVFKLGEHLAILMLRGTITIVDPLLIEYLRNGSPQMRANLAKLIGRSFSNSNEICIENLTVAKDYWTQRLLDSASIVGGNKIELEAFGWWMSANSLDEEWRMRILTQVLAATGGTIDLSHSVYEALETISQTFPEQAVAAAKSMILGAKEDWEVLGAKESLRKIILQAKSVDSRGANDAAVELVNVLGDQGLRDFRDLLPG